MFPRTLVRLLARTRSGWARGRTLPRPVVAVALVLATSFSPLAAQPMQAAVQWQASVGAQSGDKGIQALAFLPLEWTVNVGDSVAWTFATDEVHTLSFLRPDQVGPNRPPFQTPQTPPNTNPVTYTGLTQFITSGPMTKGQSYTVTFQAPPGDYTYVCLVHGKMSGTVHLQAANRPYPHPQGFYDQQAREQGRQLLVQGEQLRAQEMAATVAGPSKTQDTIGSGVATTIPNVGATSVMIARFLPGHLEIGVGDTVTWKTTDLATPHTVTFGDEPADPQTVVGTDGPGHATIASSSQAVSSGFLKAGPPPPPSQGAEFRVTFTAPGTYAYICALHDELGMVGTIIVRPAAGGPR
jgi:plastocyanin